MFKSILIISVLSSSLLFASHITIRATVAAHANTQTKTTFIDNGKIREDIYLENNYGGLTISLTDNSYGSSTLMNYIPLSISPINFSDDIHTKPTKIAELIISQKENKGSLCITVSVK